jgi:hypothetical protein
MTLQSGGPINLIAPGEKYDARNEANFRRQLEMWLRANAAGGENRAPAVAGAVQAVTGPTLTPTWRAEPNDLDANGNVVPPSTWYTTVLRPQKTAAGYWVFLSTGVAGGRFVSVAGMLLLLAGALTGATIYSTATGTRILGAETVPVTTGPINASRVVGAIDVGSEPVSGGPLTGTSLTIGGNQVVGAQGAVVTDPPSDPTGGTVQDAEARAAIVTLNDAVADMQARLEVHGLWAAA